MNNMASKIFSLMIFSLVLFTTSAHAQYTGKMEVKIPFDFVAGDTKLAAGEYTVRPIYTDANCMLLIQSHDGQKQAMVASKSMQAREIQYQRKLIFNHYGDNYFLAQVWLPGSDRGRGLFKSSHETELAKRVSNPEIVTLIGHQPTSERRQ